MSDTIKKINELKEMLDDELITLQEFNQLKNEILSSKKSEDVLSSSPNPEEVNLQENGSDVRKGIEWQEILGVSLGLIGACGYLFTKQPEFKKVRVFFLALLWNIALVPIIIVVDQSRGNYVDEEIQNTDYSSSSSSETASATISEISQNKVTEILKDWLSCKNQLFQEPYDRTCGSQVLTEKAYSNNISRTDGEQSSIEWLENSGAHYVFSNQSVDEVRNLEKINSQEATTDVVVTEQRVLYNANGDLDRKSSGYDQRLVRYNLKLADGSWKIADYNTLEVLWERQVTNQDVSKTAQSSPASSSAPQATSACLKEWSEEEHFKQALAFYRMSYDVNASSLIRHAEAKSIAQNMLDNAGFCSDLILSEQWSLIREIVMTENGM